MTRKIFNNIISHGNLEPKKDTEYIYHLDMMWRTNGRSFDVECDAKIAINVEQEEAGDYSFNLKGEGDERYRCSYGWAFIENTKRNKEIIKKIDEYHVELNKFQMNINSLRAELDDLFHEEDDQFNGEEEI